MVSICSVLHRTATWTRRDPRRVRCLRRHRTFPVYEADVVLGEHERKPASIGEKLTQRSDARVSVRVALSSETFELTPTEAQYLLRTFLRFPQRRHHPADSTAPVERQRRTYELHDRTRGECTPIGCDDCLAAPGGFGIFSSGLEMTDNPVPIVTAVSSLLSWPTRTGSLRPIEV